jgi:hypothetical protein
MKYILCLLILSQIIMFCFAIPRGTTQQEFPADAQVVGQAQPYYPPRSINNPQSSTGLSKEDWVPVDSLNLNTIIRARNQYGMQFNSMNQTMQLCTSMGEVIPEARAAIAKSPAWLSAGLQNVFSQLTNIKQQAWAAIINNAIDPYIDEIAFCVANSSVQYLASNYSDPSLFVENAQSLYSIDAELSYVQIVNYGTSTSDPNYYSTTSYYKTTADSQLVQVEVPRDIYYWYIVHPKNTDEIPAYIDPSIVESNSTHSNNIAPPPEGKFWRNYLYNVQEETFPSLRDTLIECTTAFNRNGNAGDAIKAIQWWINHTMSFTSNSERPHQPVRIYRKHIGRCGEYADYTSAAARIALIPCTSILSASTDHTWNEFWEDGWVQWEPVNGYINIPLVYEDGWGKVFGSVFEIRSDGLLTSVTDRYSTGLATITIAVLDSLNHPIDGARVILAIYEAGIKFDMIGFTGNDGLVVFPVGENRHYYARVESTVGICPPVAGTYLSLVDNSVTGEQYSFQMVLNSPMPLPQITQIPVPQDNADDWRFAIEFNTPRHLIYGKVTWDDLTLNGSQPYNEVNVSGKVNLLMTDADNYMFYNVGQMGDAFNVQTDVTSGTAMFNIPNSFDWYAFLDNSSHVANAQLVTGAMLYQHYGTANSDNFIPEAGIILYPNYPNPFKMETSIRFNLPKSAEAELSIYNIKGQKVKTLINAFQKSGLSSFSWDCKDDNAKQVSNGIYYFRLTSGGKTLTRKMLFLN